MDNGEEQKQILEEILQQTVLDAPQETILGKMAAEKGIFHVALKSKPASNRDKSVAELEVLREKLLDDFSASKSENPLDQNIKEITEAAISELCMYFRLEMVTCSPKLSHVEVESCG